MSIADAIETEWRNGNVTESARDRLLDAARAKPGASEGLRAALEQAIGLLDHLDAQARDGGGSRGMVCLTVETWNAVFIPLRHKALAALAASPSSDTRPGLGSELWVKGFADALERAINAIEEEASEVSERYVDAVVATTQAEAASPSSDTRPGLEPHPGENHEFRTTCLRCGEYGHLFVAVITDGEDVRIEPRAALAGLREALCPECDHPEREHATPGGECVHAFCTHDQSFELVVAALAAESSEPR